MDNRRVSGCLCAVGGFDGWRGDCMTDLQINVTLVKTRKRENALSYEKVSKYLSYEQNTGVFTWKVNTGRHGRILSGSQAGSLHKASGYWRIDIEGKKYKAHRLAWLLCTKSFPKSFIDHINGNKSDNTRKNLREATNQENGMNSKIPDRNASGVKGVSWNKNAEKWQSYITYNFKRIHLGLFADIAVAAEVRANAEVMYFGEFKKAAALTVLELAKRGVK